MSDFGLKISKEGVDVKDAFPEECIVHSEFPQLKVFATGSTQKVISGSPDTIVVDHNLGYRPLFVVYCNRSGLDGAGEYHLVPIYQVKVVRAYSTTTQLIVEVLNQNGDTVKIKYYIFYDTLA